MNAKTTIQVSRDTKSRLDSIGRKGDSYDSIITSLLNNRDIRMKWTEFQNLDISEQKEVVKLMNEYNNDYMFVPEGKGHYGLMTAYFDDPEVRDTLNQAIKEVMEGEE